MSLYEVRRGDEIERVEDVAQLRALARSGQLVRGDSVRVDGGAWARADALPALDGAFDVDIWDAWEDMEDVVAPPEPQRVEVPPELGETDEPTDEAPPVALPPELVQPVVTPEPARPPGRVVAMRPRRARQAAVGQGPGEEEELPEVEVEPLAEPLSPVVQPMGEVIAFPRAPSAAPLQPPRPAAEPSPRRPSSRPVASALPGRARRPGPPEAPVVPLRWFLLGALVLLAGFVIWIQVDYVRSLATWTAPGLPDEPGPSKVAEGPVTDPDVATVETPVEAGPLEPIAPTEPDSETAQLVRGLRKRIPGGAPDIGGDPDALSDAMFVDLQRVGSARSVRAEVLTWTGADQALPQLVTLYVALNAGDDPLEDLAGAGLVVGKYVTLLDLQVQSLELVLIDDSGSRTRDLSGKKAAELYQGRLSLEAFLLGEE